MLDTDKLTNKIGAANGTVLVDLGGTLDLSNSTIDQGTPHQRRPARGTTGTSTLSNLASGSGTGTFTNDGTIEVDLAAAGARLYRPSCTNDHRHAPTAPCRSTWRHARSQDQHDRPGHRHQRRHARGLYRRQHAVQSRRAARTGTFTNDGTIEVAAAATLVLDNDVLTNSIGTNGTVLVDLGGELDLKTSTIDQGTLTNIGTLKALTGSSTLSNLASGTGTGTFTNDGTIEAVATLVLDTDALTNKIGSTNGVVKVDLGGELDLKTSTIDQGTLTNIGTARGLLTGQHAVQNLASGTGTGTVHQ